MIVWANWENTQNHNQGFGFYVIVMDEFENYIFYGHLQADSCPVPVHCPVSEGQQIGLMGGTGHCIPVGARHLHLEMRPKPWTKGPVRIPEIEKLYGI